MLVVFPGLPRCDMDLLFEMLPQCEENGYSRTVSVQPCAKSSGISAGAVTQNGCTTTRVRYQPGYRNFWHIILPV